MGDVEVDDREHQLGVAVVELLPELDQLVDGKEGESKHEKEIPPRPDLTVGVDRNEKKQEREDGEHEVHHVVVEETRQRKSQPEPLCFLTGLIDKAP